MSGGRPGRRGRAPAGAATRVALPPEPPGRRSDIFGLQLVLARLGYTGVDGAPLKTDARFGADTRHALCAFQRDHGLPPGGTLDGATLEILLRRARELADRGSG